MKSVIAFASVLLAAVLAVGGSTAASAAEDDVTWAVKPATESGSDGRTWIELELDPGTTATEYLEVKNFSSRSVTFSIQAADGYFTETGRFNMLPASEPSEDAGLWIEAPSSVEVDADGAAVVPFTVTVPDNATPGDHAAGIAVAIASTGTDGEGNPVTVDSRVGFRVMTRVTGDYLPAMATSVATHYVPSWNPFSPGEVVIDYSVENTGNTRIAVDPAVVVSAPFGLTIAHLDLERIDELAPGEVRTSSARVEGAWPLVWLAARLDATGDSILDDASTPVELTGTSSTSVAAVPWPQLIVVVAAAALVFLWARERRRRRLQIQKAIDDAREEGRRASRSGAGMLALVAVVLSIGALAWSPVPGAIAATDSDEAGVTISVEVTPAASPSATPTPEPTSSPPAPTSGRLPATGASDVTTAVAAALAALGGGAALLLWHRRSTARSARTR